MVKSVLIRKSTQEIIKRSNYPSKNIAPISDLDSDMEWLVINKLDKPTYDNQTHKLIKVEEITTIDHPDHAGLNQFKISFNVVALTDEELDTLEDFEAQQKQDSHIFEGEELFNKVYAKIWRRRNKNRDQTNKLTQGEARNLMEWFHPIYLYLKTGNWHKARAEANKSSLQTLITTSNITGMTDTYNYLVAEIENYFQNDYDL